ncbi:hypothetical protein [Streptomyces sp. NPDC057413]|uniref:hypothetical protein n=1 Tax=Streptomyces sp. NPDC057413 TaxID=3346124 RepID=UPI00368E67C7
MHRLDRLAYAAELSDESAEKATALMRELRQAHGKDEKAVERAFSDAVRAAWVHGEAWAKEWVKRATGPGYSN